MSGIVGMAHFDGRPVDRALLEELTGHMAYRGPDGTNSWTDGVAGLGHAKLADTDEAVRETQPTSLDGDVWIVADARIDGRRGLVAELESRRIAVTEEPTDAELILHAYRAWGDRLAEHLLGDFSFAIWDAPRQRLVCARDHFGIKPFYYAEIPGGVLFGNTLGGLRRHPAVSSRLNETAIADYLLFEANLDPGTTTFADVQRLPPAHSLCITPSRRALERFWDFPITESSDPEPKEGWVETFRQLLRSAVDDRLRTDRVTVLMSGGLDSTSVAAVAQQLYSETGRQPGVHCVTGRYRQLTQDDEVSFAELTAQSLSVPLAHYSLDDYQLAERWGELPVAPEPGNHVIDAITHDLGRLLAARGRVVLTGFGGDPLLYPFSGYFLRQLETLRWGRAAHYLAGSLWRSRRLPPLGLQTRWIRWRLKTKWRAGYPSWLEPDFEARLGLLERWRWYQLERGPEALHPSHPGTHRILWDTSWANGFEQLDAGAGSHPLEHRHPLLDVRLVEFLMTVPPVPWCLDKLLLREAMRGLLPEAVRSRPKTPFTQQPKHTLARPGHELWAEKLERAPEIASYVDADAIANAVRQEESAATVPWDDVTRPLSLAYWLEHSHLEKSRGSAPPNSRL